MSRQNILKDVQTFEKYIQKTVPNSIYLPFKVADERLDGEQNVYLHVVFFLIKNWIILWESMGFRFHSKDV